MTLHHIDCYRLGDGADLDVLEIEGLLEEGVVVIEWGAFADLSEYSPIRGRLEVVSATERRLVLDGNVPSRVDDAMSSLHAHRGAPT